MMVTNGHVAKGEKVLILGASGGVGVCCLQLAKLAGAEVIACAGTDAKAKRLTELGADQTINYIEQDFMKEVFELYGKPTRRGSGTDRGRRRGGQLHRRRHLGEVAASVLKVGGRLLTCGATAGYRPEGRHPLHLDLRAQGPGLQRLDADRHREAARAGAERQAQGAGRQDLQLEEAREALRVIEDREVFGKIVVAP